MGRPSFSCGCWGSKRRAKFTQKGSPLLNHRLPSPPQLSPALPPAENSPAPRSQHITLLEPTSLERTLLDALLGNSHTNRLEAMSF